MTTQVQQATTKRFPEVPDDREYGLFINGRSVTARSGDTFACVDPYENREWGRVALGEQLDVDDAVRAARAAFPGWRDARQAERSGVLLRWSELIRANAEELARLQVHENGKTISEMRMAVLGTAKNAAHYAYLASIDHGVTIEPELAGHHAWTLREAKGVVGAITPWNNPLGLLAAKLFPALAVGNTIVIKPSEVTPVSTLRLIELGYEAGLPDGVANVVTGAGSAGRALAEHPDVDKLAFTGSTSTGRAIARAAAERFADVTLELGGKGAQIVFADADLDQAVEGLITGLTAGTGQACNAGSRLLIHEDIHDEVVERLTHRLHELVVGDPLDPKTEIGPLASRPQYAKVKEYLDIAHQDNYELIAGGEHPAATEELEKGLFVTPTLYGNVDPQARLAQEEIFGPVGVIIPFRTEQQALDIANGTAYGLTAGFWTRDLGRAHRVARGMKSGVVWINTWRAFSSSVPFGGVKASGVGSEGGLAALDNYVDTKAVWFRPETSDNA